ncbi:hypothetical protein F030043B2_06630 [Bacteroides fragilis]
MNLSFYHNFVVNPTIEVTPCIRISPFSESDLAYPESDTCLAKQYLTDRFHNYSLTTKAREALSIALAYYHLNKDDVVTIFTTSNNYYISSCVTKEIDKICLWSREFSDHTKLILVNHEFGYPFDNLEDLKQYGVPIIEDCAHTFVTRGKDTQIGTIGDFVIYSLPKFFPMQIGGILVSNNPMFNLSGNENISYDQDYILRHLSKNIPCQDYIIRKRLFNYSYLSDHLSEIGIRPFFELKENVIPGVFLFKWESTINYPLLKEFMQRNGVESSVFYGENAFFIPVHHRLEISHLDYMITLLIYFKNAFC